MLNNIKSYCKNQSVIIVGNCESLQYKENGNLIDSHDIIVRMNYGPMQIGQMSLYIGKKHNIYVCGIKRASIAGTFIKQFNPNFTLRLNPHGDELRSPNVYKYTNEEYSDINNVFGSNKPSTGACVIDFFNKNIEFSKLSIIGFDFFKTSHTRNKNMFMSFHWRDHSPQKEEKYIKNIINCNKNIDLLY